ncbi:MAG: ABC transporter ATP-binding protein [Gammaproteobacteria bacterium]|nr:ABC transporter ATP-binding protein [Gammaproteobacteria bacterium]MCY4256306.1 ABC transporter ATP-binding protein [Gammaproteobacteria bacterium]
MQSTNAIEIRGLRKTYPRFQLGPLDLAVPAGAIYGLVGPNGAGKTTTLDLIFGLGLPEAGEIRVLGCDHRRDEAHLKLAAAYVSPHTSFVSWKYVRRAIRFIRAFYPDWDQAYCGHLLRRFRLDPDEKIASLSLGGATKLGLVLALARRPRVLIMDEPAIGLDVPSKKDLFAELLALMGDEDHTVLISSHNLADLERFTDYIGVINEGRLLAQGRTDQLLETYRQVSFALGGEPPPGGRLFERDGDRQRVLTDSADRYSKALAQCGATGISVQPVTLEELFAGLVEGQERD